MKYESTLELIKLYTSNISDFHVKFLIILINSSSKIKKILD